MDRIDNAANKAWDVLGWAQVQYCTALYIFAVLSGLVTDSHGITAWPIAEAHMIFNFAWQYITHNSLHSTALGKRHNMTQHSTAHHSTSQHSTASGIATYDLALHRTAQYSIEQLSSIGHNVLLNSMWDL